MRINKSYTTDEMNVLCYCGGFKSLLKGYKGYSSINHNLKNKAFCLNAYIEELKGGSKNE